MVVSESTLSNIVMIWITKEIRRIELLSDQELVEEVHHVMTGDRYSWQTINRRLRELDTMDYSMCRDWKFLCDRKRSWDHYTKEHQIATSFDASVTSAEIKRRGSRNIEAYRSFLIGLKTLPILAGLGEAGILLVGSQMNAKTLVQSPSVWDAGEKQLMEARARQWEFENRAEEDTPLLGWGGVDIRSRSSPGGIHSFLRWCKNTFLGSRVRNERRSNWLNREKCRNSRRLIFPL
ncbi:hypothetical protein F5882DRAFT_378053 [Hyaloscypha sp. PMI_1271]|nr:hypothetical protein F5882DRAFT_378053 [Hyaloscypha sp. PMI_1271]